MIGDLKRIINKHVAALRNWPSQPTARLSFNLPQGWASTYR